MEPQPQRDVVMMLAAEAYNGAGEPALPNSFPWANLFLGERVFVFRAPILSVEPREARRNVWLLCVPQQRLQVGWGYAPARILTFPPAVAVAVAAEEEALPSPLESAPPSLEPPGVSSSSASGSASPPPPPPPADFPADWIRIEFPEFNLVISPPGQQSAPSPPPPGHCNICGRNRLRTPFALRGRCCGV